MLTVTVKDKYAESLSIFGDLQAAVDLALQRYTIEQITARLVELRQRNVAYQKKYGLDYEAFAKRSAEDEAFVHDIEARINKTWETDLADWEFCYRGIQDWTQRLQTLLLGS